MTKSKSVKTGALAGMVIDPTAHLDGPKTGHEFEARLREDVEKRLAETARVGWQKLANGLTVSADLVATTCDHCKLVNWVKPDKVNAECLCYSSGAAWKRRAMTKVEVAAWSKRQIDARAQWLAEGPGRRAVLNAFNQRKDQDDPEANRSFVRDPSRSVGRA